MSPNGPPLHDALRFKRDPLSRRIDGYQEVGPVSTASGMQTRDGTLGMTAATADSVNPMASVARAISFQRPPDKHSDYARGSTRNIPFAFGGMEQALLESGGEKASSMGVDDIPVEGVWGSGVKCVTSTDLRSFTLCIISFV